ncbi:hypothetical protein [Serratia ureilytica]|uniref:hypothetical protein n=1 Tax=Serratia ureilytica TaxID=300181 RepID=UPI0011873B79|nr:hypothetical protein [Serratia ureilytica]
MRDAQEELTLETEKLEEMERKNSRTKSALNLQSQLNGTRREGIDLLRRDSEQTGIAADMMNHLLMLFSPAELRRSSTPKA